MANNNATETTETIDLSGDSPPASPKIAKPARKTETKITDLFTTGKATQGQKRKADSDFDDDDGYVSDTARSAKSQETRQDTPLDAATNNESTTVAVTNAAYPVQQDTPSPQNLTECAHEASATPSLPRSSISIRQPSQSGVSSNADTLPKQAKKPLQDIPELHPRYVPKYIDPASRIALKDPKRFCVKPPYWRRWKTSQYHDLAEDLRQQWDPVPFATKHSLTVEEVRAVFTATVCDPLYDAPEKARKAIEGGMEDMFDSFNNHGTQPRIWTNNNGIQIKAEFTRIEKGKVQLLLADGRVKNGDFARLSAGDQEYLREMVREDDLQVPLGGDGTSASGA